LGLAIREQRPDLRIGERPVEQGEFVTPLPYGTSTTRYTLRFLLGDSSSNHRVGEVTSSGFPEPPFAPEAPTQPSSTLH
jgi:hypothetical protein